MDILRLHGQEAREYVKELAALRVGVFYDFPYLYEGSIEYEEQYLETYFQAQNSFILLLRHQGRFVGATSGIHAVEETKEFREPFIQKGYGPEAIFYFGESVLLPEYRGKGFGKLFFSEREAFARSLGMIRQLSFCAVERPIDHPLRPEGYIPLDEFWKGQGFSKVPGLTTKFEWLDRGDKAQSFKSMQFWMKHLGG